MRKITLFIIIFLILLIIGGASYWIYFQYRQARIILNTKIEYVFKQTIEQNGKTRLQELNIPYASIITPFFIREKKEYGINILNDLDSVFVPNKESINKDSEYVFRLNSDQSYLYMKNPIDIKCLDSIFQKKLENADITTKSKIRYIDRAKNKKDYAEEDTLFFKSASLSNQIVLGLKDEIELQVYTKISFMYILQVIFHETSFPFFFCIIVFALITLLYLRKRKLLFAEKKLEPVSGALPIVEKYTEVPLIQIDLDKHVFCYKGMEYTTQKQNLQLLQLFLDKPEYFLTQEELVLSLWGNIDKYDSRLNKLIHRARFFLKDIEGLEINTIKGDGYQLVITL